MIFIALVLAIIVVWFVATGSNMVGYIEKLNR